MQFFTDVDNDEEAFPIFVTEVSDVFISKKEAADYKLAVELRAQGKIDAPGALFEALDKKEIGALLSESVLVPIKYDEAKHYGIRIFKARMVREVKGKMDKPYEKSRLVVQGYNDEGKRDILTQSPTI